MATVLVVEDESMLQKFYNARMEEYGHKTIAATTVDEGFNIFLKRRVEIDIVVFDGQLKRGSLIETTPSLAARIRDTGFRGPMVATSSYADLRQQLMEAGCTYEVEDKSDLWRTLLEIIEGLPKRA